MLETRERSNCALTARLQRLGNPSADCYRVDSIGGKGGTRTLDPGIMTRAQQLSPRTHQSLPHARGNAFALFRAADRLGICVQQDVQMNSVKNKAERSHALPRELWPILALIFTVPVLFVNVILRGGRELKSAWIFALIGLPSFGFLGRRK